LPLGNWNERHLSDIFFRDKPELQGPFRGPGVLQQFHDICGIDIFEPIPIAFTHNDLTYPNILLSKGPRPKVVAVIDWAQSGWYPSYWEICKARRIGVPPEWMSNDMQDEWQAKYLAMFLDPVDEEQIYHPFLYFVLSKGI
jgi:hypothetical protein